MADLSRERDAGPRGQRETDAEASGIIPEARAVEVSWDQYGTIVQPGHALFSVRQIGRSQEHPRARLRSPRRCLSPKGCDMASHGRDGARSCGCAQDKPRLGLLPHGSGRAGLPQRHPLPLGTAQRAARAEKARNSLWPARWPGHRVETDRETESGAARASWVSERPMRTKTRAANRPCTFHLRSVTTSKTYLDAGRSGPGFFCGKE